MYFIIEWKYYRIQIEILPISKQANGKMFWAKQFRSIIKLSF